MAILTQGKRPWDFVLSEAAGMRSRENVTIAASQDFESGQVLGKIANTSGVTVTAAADADNTASSGALTLASPAYTSAVQEGKYSVVCIEPVTNGGKFRVEDPAGREIGTATVASAFAKQVKFTIADATDFVAGDKFVITVEFGAGGKLYKAWNQDATDGSEVPAAIAGTPVVTESGETKAIAVLARDAEVNQHQLRWSADATDAEIDIGRDQLAELGIIVR